MTTTEIIKQLSIRLKISQVEARRCLNNQLESIVETIAEGEQVTLRRFGTFGVKQTTERKTFIPSEQKHFIVPSRKVAFFRASNWLKDFVKTWQPK